MVGTPASILDHGVTLAIAECCVDYSLGLWHWSVSSALGFNVKDKNLIEATVF